MGLKGAANGKGARGTYAAKLGRGLQKRLIGQLLRDLKPFSSCLHLRVLLTEVQHCNDPLSIEKCIEVVKYKEIIGLLHCVAFHEVLKEELDRDNKIYGWQISTSGDKCRDWERAPQVTLYLAGSHGCGEELGSHCVQCSRIIAYLPSCVSCRYIWILDVDTKRVLDLRKGYQKLPARRLLEFGRSVSMNSKKLDQSF